MPRHLPNVIKTPKPSGPSPSQWAAQFCTTKQIAAQVAENERGHMFNIQWFVVISIQKQLAPVAQSIEEESFHFSSNN